MDITDKHRKVAHGRTSYMRCTLLDDAKGFYDVFRPRIGGMTFAATFDTPKGG